MWESNFQGCDTMPQPMAIPIPDTRIRAHGLIRIQSGRGLNSLKDSYHPAKIEISYYLSVLNLTKFKKYLKCSKRRSLPIFARSLKWAPPRILFRYHPLHFSKVLINGVSFWSAASSWMSYTKGLRYSRVSFWKGSKKGEEGPMNIQTLDSSETRGPFQD